jgi:Phosphotransferase enzyme family
MNIPTAQALLQQTVTLHISSTAKIVQVRELPIDSEHSGTAVRRYELTLDEMLANRTTIQLVIKESVLSERRTLAHLDAQLQPGVPYFHTLDLETDAFVPICMQDLGGIQRPTSLDPIKEITLRREAAGLAAIHAANWGCASELAWLPHADRSYFAQMIEQTYWRPHWEQIVRDPTFRVEFGSDLPRIEAAAGTIVDDMAALYNEADALTLVHTDINPSNVLLLDGIPYFIDWHAAHFGPCYLDVPHHFFTPALAEYYRAAMLAHGINLPRDTFTERFCIAARYTALRYMWWTFDAWREDHTMDVWVRHYFSMI